jgi:uncharacterized repeat protein (TIGR03803 family)
MSAHLRRIVVVISLVLPIATSAAAQTTTRYEIVHRFSSDQGSYPHGFLIQGSDGALYGTFRWGPAMVFRMTLDGTLTVLANQSDAAYEPWAGLVQGPDGAFYGTTYHGGPVDAGTVFRVTASGEFTVLHTFTSSGLDGSSDGRHPRAALIESADGTLYGTTADGGTNDAGVVFRITREGVYTTLRSFPRQPGDSDAGPRSPLLQIAGDPDGLYGTVRSGGRYGIGTRGFGAIFRTTTTNPDPYAAPVVLHDFEGAPNDGADPGGGLIVGPDGNLYSTTYLGGAVGAEWGNGTVFKVTPLGVVTILHSFAGGTEDGSQPQGGVILARDGNFYGATHDGGVYNLGVVYRMTPSGEVTLLHSFARGSDGASPYAGLVEASDGALYGMTAGGGGGDVGAGTIYRIRFVQPPAPVIGFDADTKADMPLYDATTGTWRILTSSSDYHSSWEIYWGGPEYTAVPADYDGDGRLDVAVYHAGRGIWYVLTSSSHFTSVIMATFGGLGYTPVAGDFDGDQKADFAVYRRTTGEWAILQSSDHYTRTLTVARGGVPIRGDFDGDFVADAAIYLPATGAWRVLTSRSGFTTLLSTTLGGAGFAPVPGDYDGDRITDMAVYNGATGDWQVRQSTSSFTTVWTLCWGGTGYDPVPGDYDADGKTDLGVYDAARGEWFVLQSGSDFTTTLRAVWGTPIDTVVTSLPVRTAWTDTLRATDFDGDGTSDLVVYEPATGVWSILTSSSHFTQTRTITWGGPTGDVPVPGDYDGDGLADAAVFNPTLGVWSIRRSSQPPLTVIAGGPGDIPVPGDYDGDGITDVAVYAPWYGAWRLTYSHNDFGSSQTVTAGAAWWTPVPADYDGDGRTDLGLYDGSAARWQVQLATSNFSTPPLTMVWGGSGHTVVPGDFDGDGQADFSACRNATGKWWVLKSGFSYTTAFGVPWGYPIDTPRAADYDGDGLADMASYDATTGQWYLRLSSSYFTLTLGRTLGGPGFILPRTS